MQKPDFRYTLLAFDRRFVLNHSPVGWDDVAFKGESDERYKVLRRKFSSSLKFVFEGADVISSVFLTQGIDGVAELIVDEFDTESYLYNEIYRSEIDYSTYLQEVDGISISTMDNKVASNIKAHEDVVYEIDIDDNPEAVTVNIGGIGVDQFASFLSETFLEPEYIGDLYVSPFMVLEDSTTETEFASPEVSSGPTSGDEPVDITRFIEFNKDFTARFQGKGVLKFTPSLPLLGSDYLRFTFILGDKEFAGSVGIVYQKFIRAGDLAESGPTSIEFEFDKSGEVFDGSRYIFYVQQYDPRVTDRTTTFCVFTELELKVSYQAYTDDYICKGLRPMTVLNTLMKEMNPGVEIECISSILSEKWKNILLFSGDSLRGISGSKLQTTYQDFFDSYDIQLYLGMDVIGLKVILENMPYFKNRFVKKASIGEVKNPRFAPNLAYHYTSIEVGYENQEYQTVDGKDEQNTTEVWSVASTRSPKKKSLISPYRADPRGVDQLLIDFRLNPTQDTKSDTEVFMILISNTIEDGIYLLEGTGIYKNVSGLSSLGRSYNIPLSPKHILLRHAPELSVHFAIQKTGDITFKSSKKNAEMVITYNDDTKFIEKESIQYETIEPPIMLPIICTCEISLTSVKFNEILNDPSYGYILFTIQGKEYRGFISTDEFLLEKKSPKDIIFELTPESNLPTLHSINYIT